MKTCCKCRAVKPLAEFYKQRDKADGHQSACKACKAECQAAYHAKNTDRVRASKVAYNAKNADRKREYQAAYEKTDAGRAVRARSALKYRAEHPERIKAKNAVTHAIQAGRLTPQPCFCCGAKAEAHHPNYDAPLDVVWLCPPHHRQAHAIANLNQP
jgi:hypothetical protein